MPSYFKASPDAEPVLVERTVLGSFDTENLPPSVKPEAAQADVPADKAGKKSKDKEPAPVVQPEAPQEG